MDIRNKKVLITGASKGIGKAIALLLAKEGAEVIVNYNTDEFGAKEVQTEIQKLGGICNVIKADVTDENAVKFLFSEIKGIYQDGIDVLVNNAGIFAENDSATNFDSFKKDFNTNFFGPIMVTNQFIKQTKTGKIVFITSLFGRVNYGGINAIAYASSKAALDSYMKNLARYLAPNILVNSVAPGRTITPMWGELEQTEKKQLAEGHLTNRWIEPNEIAEGVKFILQNDSMCGEILTIDGGMSLKTFGE